MSKVEARADQEGQSEAENLRRVVAEYEARVIEVADYVAQVRHEINNPLTGLLGQAQLLLREELPDATRRRIQIIESLAARIRDTVAELRVVQRPQATANYALTMPGRSSKADG